MSPINAPSWEAGESNKVKTATADVDAGSWDGSVRLAVIDPAANGFSSPYTAPSFPFSTLYCFCGWRLQEYAVSYLSPEVYPATLPHVKC